MAPPPSPTLRACRRAALVASAGLLLSACPQAAPVDGDTESDGALDEFALFDAPDPEAGPPDRDGDGLCDTTELAYQTDPDNPDTDGDGLIDSFEVAAWTSPLSAADPTADERVTLREEPGATAQAFVQMYYRGAGESLTGLMLERINGVDDRTATEITGTIAALTAEPRGAVADLIGPQFTAVTGLVRLRWLFTLAWPSAAAPIGCRRGYVGSPAVFAEGRGIVYGRTLVIDVLAARDTPGLDAGPPPDDASSDDGAGPPTGPRWPFVAHGLCLPRPGACR